MAAKNKKGAGYYLLFGAFSLVAMLPFSVLYFISDIVYILVYHVAGYRKKVVRKNLVNSFPKKKEEEILQIEKKFYRHLCDYFVETIKTLRISDKEIRKRMVFRNSSTKRMAFCSRSSSLPLTILKLNCFSRSRL